MFEKLLAEVAAATKLREGPEGVRRILWLASRALVEACSDRPAADVRLDQSHGTPRTALYRALYKYECDALLGRKVLVLGDDDLLSIALALLARHMAPGGDQSATVVDVNPRVLGHVDACAGREGLGVATHRLDLRSPLPAELCEGFDVFATDPPYTEEGLRLFVSRALQVLVPGRGRQGFVSFAHTGPVEMLSLCGQLFGMGLSISEIIPGFNRYEGAQILAGSSEMIRVNTVANRRPAWEGACAVPIYTAQVAAAPAGRDVS